MKLILASESQARRRLLRQLLGHSRFLCRPALIDEKLIERQQLAGRETSSAITEAMAKKVARWLALAKAEKVWNALSENSKRHTVVIGSDQLLYCPHLSRIVGKPGSFERADRFLSQVQGHSAVLLTAVAVVSAKTGSRVLLQSAQLEFAKLPKKDRQAILRADRPFHCAGSFKIEGRGVALFKSVRSDDPTGIQGLPLMRLRGLLLGAGYS